MADLSGTQASLLHWGLSQHPSWAKCFILGVLLTAAGERREALRHCPHRTRHGQAGGHRPPHAITASTLPRSVLVDRIHPDTRLPSPRLCPDTEPGSEGRTPPSPLALGSGVSKLTNINSTFQAEITSGRVPHVNVLIDKSEYCCSMYSQNNTPKITKKLFLMSSHPEEPSQAPQGPASSSQVTALRPEFHPSVPGTELHPRPPQGPIAGSHPQGDLPASGPPAPSQGPQYLLPRHCLGPARYMLPALPTQRTWTWPSRHPKGSILRSSL